MANGYAEFWSNLFLASCAGGMTLWAGLMIVLIGIHNELRSMKRRGKVK